MRKIKLSMGCHERTQAWTGVSPQRGGNTKKDSARVVAKPSSKMWTVTRGLVSQIIGRLDSGQVFPDWRLQRMSKIVCRVFPESAQGGTKTYGNRTGELQCSCRTTYREGKHRVAGPHMTSGQRAGQ